jgi:AcrR family transcriptional regulator
MAKDAASGRDAGDGRKKQLRERLIAAAEAAIARGGLPALKARDAAQEAGCALGAIYTVFEDLDELILCVNLKTLARLEERLAAATPLAGEAELQRLAAAYLAYARDEGPRWRALFDHSMPHRDLPAWYANERDRLFRRLEAPLAALLPTAAPEKIRALSRTLFSAVHGIARFGLEEKLESLPPAALEASLFEFVAALASGLKSA